MRWWSLVVAVVGLTACQEEEGTDRTKTGPVAVGFLEGDMALESQDYSIMDEFVFHVSPVDVLFVIDDSCSMIEEQEALNIGFPGFFSLLEIIGDQYHIGVLSTDMDDPAKQGSLIRSGDYAWIDADTPEPFVVFEEIAKLGTKGSGDERGRDAVWTALQLADHSEAALPPGKVDTDNAGFYREEAALMVVAVSDEPDFSVVSLLDFGTWFPTLKPKAEPGWLTFNGIIGPPGGCGGGDAQEGEGYIEIIEAVGGIAHSICDIPYGDALTSMIGQLPSEEFFLSEIPAAETIVISATEPSGNSTLLRESDWTYYPAENMVMLNRALEDDAAIFIRYLPLSLLAQ